MLSLHRVLFPTDYGEGAAPALDHAVLLAERHGARLEVLHVTGPSSAGTTRVDFTAYQARLAAAGAQFVEVDRPGDSALRTILDYAGESDADLIVMATRGRRVSGAIRGLGLERFLMGGVSEQIVRAAECPVLTVAPRAPAPAGDVHRILVPLDFSAHSEIQLRHAVALAEIYDASIDLLHAVHVPAMPPDYGIAPIGSDRTRTFVEGSRTALQALAARHIPEARRGASVVEVGHPAEVILDVVEERVPGLVVLATHGLTGLKRFALGSVAEHVVRRAQTAVFTVKSFGKSLLTEGAQADAAHR